MLPASFVPGSAEQAEQLLFALRGLYRDHLERRRLDSGGAESVTVRSASMKGKER